MNPPQQHPSAGRHMQASKPPPLLTAKLSAPEVAKSLEGPGKDQDLRA